MTKGGDQGLSGRQDNESPFRDARVITAFVFTGFGLLYVVVNAASLIDQRRALGQPIAHWQAWVLESTSFAAWLVLLPLMLVFANRLLSRSLPLATLGHIMACAAVSLAHTALIAVMRTAAFALAGEGYAPSEAWTDRLLFEARKDLMTYILILAVFLLARQLVSRPLATLPSRSDETPLIEVRDGSRVVILRPAEIDWVGAAGNYVELHGSFGSQLARRTMADLESELAPHGFVRVHRSHLVRRAAIAAMETRQSGDFDIVLRSGAVISGSRRFRQNLV